MRIGSPHKQDQHVSRDFKRPLTGSKGVGRLAVQFLARQLSLKTVSKSNTHEELIAYVDWDEAVQAKELIDAKVKYMKIVPPVTQFPDDAPHGTSITLANLNQEWTTEKIVGLAQEIWSLQPPFRANPDLREDRRIAFDVEMESPDEEALAKFKEYMNASLKIWQARLTGVLTEDTEENARIAVVALEFDDKTRYVKEYSVPDCELHSAAFEIRIFDLQHRQPYGIKVDEARDYFRKHGGIHVYDAGFHLPYYGNEDWLDIERDHARRLGRSKLLPEELQLVRGLNFLPKKYRLYGVVNVNTSKEREAAIREGRDRQGDYLQIQISRDRLADNKAFRNLYFFVRWAMDFYAVQKKRRELEAVQAKRPTEPIQRKFERVDQVLARFESSIPEPVYKTLRTQVKDAIDASEAEAETLKQQRGVLGSLATAGMSALAYEHEVQKQYNLLENVVAELENIQVRDGKIQDRLGTISKDLKEWIRRARATRNLFSYLLDEENRDLRARFKAKQLLDDVTAQMSVLLRGVQIDLNQIDDSLRLPEAGYAEWSSIFQNVLINAVNAMLDSRKRLVVINSHSKGRKRTLLIQDTGSGVELEKAAELFKPFVRKQIISPERRALGAGGSGLGLTIVRMIADSINCDVSFVKPEEGFSTAFQISWTESK